MMAKSKLKRAGAAMALAVGLAFIGQAQAQAPAAGPAKVTWRLQSAFGSSLTHLGPAAVRFVKDVEDMTDGNFVIKFH